MTQKPIATVSIPEGRESVKFEVMREHVRGGDWHNRYVRDAKTKADLTPFLPSQSLMLL